MVLCHQYRELDRLHIMTVEVSSFSFPGIRLTEISYTGLGPYGKFLGRIPFTLRREKRLVLMSETGWGTGP